jgi:hypothetical protein
VQNLGRLLWGVVLSGMLVSTGAAEEETTRVVGRLLEPPKVQTAAGFTAKVLVPPGQLYDPLFMLPHADAVWLNDDGAEEKDKGSRLLAVDKGGKISVVAGLGKLLPTVGFDLAPSSFGEFGGQVFTLTQAKVATEGATANHMIHRLDPQQGFAATAMCTLPEAGALKIAGFGADARFGPEGSPFAGKFFAVTALNNAIYQVTADGKCTPFIVFDGEQYSAPFVIAFAPDGKTMLVSVSRGRFDIAGTAEPSGAIVRVSPEGKIVGEVASQGLGRPMGMDFAPEGFGAYGGQLFVSDVGRFQIPVPMTQPLVADGKVYRITPEGKPVLVAGGMMNPVGVRFVGNTLWITDVNGDFIAGKRELPDGFIVTIQAQ